ncbi:PREDICTED: uncharacterized protein At1g43920, Chloroplastic-like [Camelina sativa]|uniref:Uncharacterized protein At1g43920, Chloroplastic-like n=1 Tax=Camelina sativa TaxID=90675 RepID=A0ABM1QLA3_CAMSA|nr:PREDICTED: uncharacterized protein At1g43920, Chloroplastic-like [Camelina sativa]
MSSSSITSCSVGERGIPSKCICGLGVTTSTSKTQENPGSPFFRCASKQDVNSCTSKKDSHLFKWVEDAVFEEVEDALPRLAIIAEEISKTKAEVNELNVVMKELKEEANFSKKELQKCKLCLKVCFVWFCVITIVLGYVLFREGDKKKLMLGY